MLLLLQTTILSSLLLIIAFSSSTLGIRYQNDNETDMIRGKAVITVSFFPENEFHIRARQADVGEAVTRVSRKITFPDMVRESYMDRQGNLNQRNYYQQSEYRTNDNYQPRQNPYDPSLNTGEVPRPYGNPENKYRLIPNTIYGIRPAGPGYSTYAQNYNYNPNALRPNYIPGPYRLIPAPNNQHRYPYYGPQRPLPPYGPNPSQYREDYPAGSSGAFSSLGSNPLMSFLNFIVPQGLQGLQGIQGPQLPNFGGKFVKALEDIARNDDLQCVPKLLCDMVGNPKRRASLPSFISSPSFSALIAALPSTSPALIFGRAALLGFTGGEGSCESTYPKCPRNEDDLLYYLNNHRGGFFKFFNDGSSFGNEADYQQQQDDYDQDYQQQDYQQQQQQHQQQQQQPAQGTPQGVDLQSLASFLTQMGGGLNLANLGLLTNLASLFTGAGAGIGSGKTAAPQKPIVNKENSYSMKSIVSNLLTGLVGNYFTSRKFQRRSSIEFPSEAGVFVEEHGHRRSKRSIDAVEKLPEVKDDKKEVKSRPKKYNSNIDEPTKKQNDSKSDSKDPAPNPLDDVNSKTGETEGRIVNKKHIYAEDELIGPFFERVIFPEEEANSLDLPPREGKSIKFEDDAKTRYEPYIRYPPYTDDDIPNEYPESYRRGKRIVFQSPASYAPDFSKGTFVTDFKQATPYGENSYSTRMIFPDRTGTGNLRFDNDKFYNVDRIRAGRILTRPVSSYKRYEPEPTTYRPYYHNYDRYTTTPRPVYKYATERPSYSRKTYPVYTSAAYTYTPQNNNPNIYVTNSRGIVEYYITPRGEKIYV